VAIQRELAKVVNRYLVINLKMNFM